MPYGIMIRNGRNVTIIDEDTPAATVLPGTTVVTKEGTGISRYSMDLTFLQNSLPAVQLTSSVRDITMYSSWDTQGTITGNSPLFRMHDLNGNLPDTFPAKRIIPFSALTPSSDAYGMRIRNGSGALMFDSGYNMASPTQSRIIRRGQEFDLPSNCWMLFLSAAMYNDNNFNYSSGIRRVDGTSNRWYGYCEVFGSVVPALNSVIAKAMFFENL